MKKIFHVIENEDDLKPYAVTDETDTVVCVGFNPRKLAEWAFANGADEVAHEYDLRKAEDVIWK